MYIDNKHKVRSVAGKNIIILQGQFGTDTTKVLELNDTSLYLWNRFTDAVDFTVENVAEALIENYKIDATLAQQDAKSWIDFLTEYNVILK